MAVEFGTNLAGYIAMYFNQIGSEITIAINSKMSQVSRALELTRKSLGPSIDSTNLPIVLRELLANAVIHGNSGEPLKIVRCSISDLGRGRFRIEVRDEGEGFDHRAINMDLPENPARLRRRGYILIKALSEKIDFYDHSSRVIVYVDTKGEALYSIKNLSKA